VSVITGAEAAARWASRSWNIAGTGSAGLLHTAWYVVPGPAETDSARPDPARSGRPGPYFSAPLSAPVGEMRWLRR